MTCKRMAVALIFAPLLIANHSGEAQDPETRAWWELASEISSDAFEGRATGSAGYERAAVFVAARLAAAGFEPLGENGELVPADIL